MLTSDEIQLQLKDVRQAMQLEREHQFVDIQGRKKRFSKFIFESLNALGPYLMGPTRKNSKDFELLLQGLRHYNMADLQTRMKLLEKVTGLFDSAKDEQEAFHNRRGIARYDGKNPAEIDVQYLKGVGPNIAKMLYRLDIRTIQDLLHYYPKRYLDYQNRTSISQLAEGQDAMIIATVKSVSVHMAKGKNLGFLTVLVTDQTGTFPATWLYAKSSLQTLHSHKSRFPVGAEVILTGKVRYDSYKHKLAMERPDVEFLSMATTTDDTSADTANRLHSGRIVPVYALVEGLSHKLLRRAIHHALLDYLGGMSDPLQPTLRQQEGLIDIQTAIEQIHFPDSQSAYEAARERLVFDEFFALQLRLACMRQAFQSEVHGLQIQCKQGGLVDKVVQSLPFRLTRAQRRVLDEISMDLSHPKAMYRLLQGDVGSGKTIVALLTLLMAVENGYQGVLMAPTEILAEQHARTFVNLLTPFGIRVGVFLGKAGLKERRELRQSLLNGQIQIAIGTHALIQDDVVFQNLGIVVVDEQHRFGVRQRLTLKKKGDNPQMLSMTATPIPRTLAMSVYGDMDVSILDELPPGRTPIKTVVFHGKRQREEAYQLIQQQVRIGRQAYIVFPMIEESETLTAKAATVVYEELRHTVFANLKLGLLHGKLSSDERDRIMGKFLAKEMDVLIATTVIEVGVDVPNATVMIIENAERFGLSQLHQLRGRVGRSSHQSYCVLLSESRGEEAIARLEIMATHEDGFYIAEKDLEIRGPGEFLGTRQSGLPQFSLANLITDQDLLEKAKSAAFRLVAEDPGLLHHLELKAVVFQSNESELGSILTAG